jgi:hypothetical protein
MGIRFGNCTTYGPVREPQRLFSPPPATLSSWCPRALAMPLCRRLVPQTARSRPLMGPCPAPWQPFWQPEYPHVTIIQTYIKSKITTYRDTPALLGPDEFGIVCRPLLYFSRPLYLCQFLIVNPRAIRRRTWASACFSSYSSMAFAAASEDAVVVSYPPRPMLAVRRRRVWQRLFVFAVA